MDDWEPIPLSRLSHTGFCLRRAALLTNEQVWSENADTAKGRSEHERVHTMRVERRGDGGGRTMKKLPETLYITTPESYLFERNGNICISIGGAERASVPISQVNSIVLFGKTPSRPRCCPSAPKTT